MTKDGQELVMQIDGGHFVAGLVVNKFEFCTEAAPIIKYMRNWSLPRIRSYCSCRNWKLSKV